MSNSIKVPLHSTPLDESILLRALEQYGIPYPPSTVVRERFSKWGRKGRYWAIACLDGYCFGHFKDGIKEKVFPQRKLTKEERKQRDIEIQRIFAKADKEQKEKHQKAMSVASNVCKASTPVVSDKHAYLQRKKVKSFGLRTISVSQLEKAGVYVKGKNYEKFLEGEESLLVIPLQDTEGKIHSVQFINSKDSSDEQSNKMLLRGGKKKGNYCPIGTPPEADGYILLCEGCSTGASLHEATAQHTIVCIDAGNLLAVAKAVKAKYPKAKMIMCADDDSHKHKDDLSKINTGLEKAIEAAQAVGAYVLSPVFGDVSDKPSDFNDLHCKEGIEAVKKQANECLQVIAEGESRANIFPPVVAKPSKIAPPQDEWGDIDLSFLEEEQVEPIDYVDVFGEELASYIETLARASSCSKEYVMLLLLVISSVIIGNKRKVKAKKGWLEPVHLWGALVGNPSCKKSASMKPFYEALKPLSDRRAKDYKTKRSAYLERVKSIKKVAEDKSIWNELIGELKKPVLRQVILNDATSEAVCKAIDSDNSECICLYRDELVGFMKGLEKYNKNDKSLYLEGYNGNPYTINRVKIDEPKQISELSISLLGGIQPEKLGGVIKTDDDGFLSRFLFVYSEPIKVNVMEDCAFDIVPLQQIFNKLDTELSDRVTLSLTEDAKASFQSFIDKHQSDSKYVSGILASSYGKMEGQALRIACVLEHVSWAMSANDCGTPAEVTKQALERAIDLMEFYFKPMAGKVFSECSKDRNNVSPLLKNFVKYLASLGEDLFNWRETVDRGKFKQLKNEKEKAIDFLAERSIIMRVTNSQTGGRQREEYRINPQLKSAFIELASLSI